MLSLFLEEYIIVVLPLPLRKVVYNGDDGNVDNVHVDMEEGMEKMVLPALGEYGGAGGTARANQRKCHGGSGSLELLCAFTLYFMCFTLAY